MIRKLALPGTGLEASCLGFGCASLGSRISAGAGLRALAHAYEQGVTWFDVAPAYGLGEAEAILGRFLEGRRSEVRILTKVGLAPPRRAPWLRLAHATVRPFGGVLRSLRKATQRGGAGRNLTLELTPELIDRSIAQSLAHLQVEAVDVLALHDPDPESVVSEPVVSALERARARGQARLVGVAGSPEACLAGAHPGLPYAVFQTASHPFAQDAALIRQRAGKPVTIIGHSVFGVGGTLETMRAKLRRDRAARGALAAAGYDPRDLDTAISALLLDAALAQNSEGITLVSMFSTRHLARNLARAEGPPRPASLALLRKLLA